MRTVDLSELRTRLGYYISLAEQGEEVVITRRGVPVAKITPLPPPGTKERALLEQQIAKAHGEG